MFQPKEKRPTRQQTITVEKRSEKGIFAEGQWYNLSTYAENLPDFKVGCTYDLTLKQSAKGVEFVTAANITEGSAIVETSMNKTTTGVIEEVKKAQLTYESRDDYRQRLIVRQSCLKAAIDYVGDDSPLINLFQIAEDMVNWVFEESKKVERPLTDGTSATDDLYEQLGK